MYKVLNEDVIIEVDEKRSIPDTIYHRNFYQIYYLIFTKLVNLPNLLIGLDISLEYIIRLETVRYTTSSGKLEDLWSWNKKNLIDGGVKKK